MVLAVVPRCEAQMTICTTTKFNLQTGELAASIHSLIRCSTMLNSVPQRLQRSSRSYSNDVLRTQQSCLKFNCVYNFAVVVVKDWFLTWRHPVSCKSQNLTLTRHQITVQKSSFTVHPKYHLMPELLTGFGKYAVQYKPEIKRQTFLASRRSYILTCITQALKKTTAKISGFRQNSKKTTSLISGFSAVTLILITVMVDWALKPS